MRIHCPDLGPKSHPTVFIVVATFFLCLFVPTVTARSARIKLKPGFNTFTPEQDIEVGREAVKDVEKQMPVVANAQFSEYVNRLGQNLARYAPGYRFPYRFTLINAKEINAFALPGGPIYVHTGVIAAAASEAQLAGVLAHEISHVALRHSTNQASKAMLAQAPLAILGGVLSGGGLGGQLAQLGIAFGMNSAFLKFSRGAEQQADEQGAQILYDAGYDLRAMAQFFETIERESGNRALEFLSSHPNPGNREKNILQLIPKLGPSKSYSADNSEFEAMKRRAVDLKAPEQGGRRPASTGRSQPAEPSRRLRALHAEWCEAGYPDNWQVYGQGTSTLTLVPSEGIIPASEGSLPAIAYGALISIYESAREPGRRLTLPAATDQLVRQLQQSNANLRVISRAAISRRLAGQETLSLTALGRSPLEGESKLNWIVTTFRPEGLWYISLHRTRKILKNL